MELTLSTPHTQSLTPWEALAGPSRRSDLGPHALQAETTRALPGLSWLQQLRTQIWQACSPCNAAFKLLAFVALPMAVQRKLVPLWSGETLCADAWGVQHMGCPANPPLRLLGACLFRDICHEVGAQVAHRHRFWRSSWRAPWPESPPPPGRRHPLLRPPAVALPLRPPLQLAPQVLRRNDVTMRYNVVKCLHEM